MAYKVPFVDYPLHYHRMQAEIDAAIKDILEGGDFIMRRHLDSYERNLAAFVGVDYAVGLNSGSDALLLSLLAAGVGAGDEVITVSHTFVATTAAIVHCGAKPVLVDVAEDFNMDMSKVEPAITNKTKAIIPVHLNGRMCDMTKLREIAARHNLIIIEDAAQALGASYDGRMAGSFGYTGCFSHYPAKTLGGFGDGGSVTTDSREANEKIRLLRDHGQERATGDILFYGYNSRLDNLQAAILDVKLKYLPTWIERRRELAAIYGKGLKGIPQVKTPPPPEDGRCYDVYTNYVIRAEERDKLAAHLRESGVEIIISWPKPMHLQEALGLSRFHLPETERVSREVISLPLNTEVSDEQIAYVIETVRKFYKA